MRESTHKQVHNEFYIVDPENLQFFLLPSCFFWGPQANQSKNTTEAPATRHRTWSTHLCPLEPTTAEG